MKKHPAKKPSPPTAVPEGFELRPKRALKVAFGIAVKPETVSVIVSWADSMGHKHTAKAFTRGEAIDAAAAALKAAEWQPGRSVRMNPASPIRK